MSSTSSSASRDVSSDALEQAIAWIVRLRSGMLDDAAQRRLQQEVQAWRQAAPAHEAAWQELQAVEQGFAAVQATQRAHAARTLQTVVRHRGTRQSRRKALRVLGWGGVGVAVGALALSQSGWQPGWRTWSASLAADHATAVGERRSITLPDGTRIALNTDTAIDVRYTETQRTIVLHRGEIFIQTGSDGDHAGGHRRFFVRTAQTRLEAIGTGFLVQQEAQHTRLQVAQGSVAIRASEGDGTRDLIAAAGEAWRIDAQGRARALEEIAFDATAWLDGALVARQMRLGDLVAQLARHRRGWLRCDPAIADLRVSGVFQLDDTDRALASLVQTLPIAMVSHTRYWVTLQPM